MARTNRPTPAPRTHEGMVAARLTPEQALRRSVMSCLLFEDEFYEDGESIAERIWKLAAEVSPQTLAAYAIEAREQMHLRHAPLMLLSALAKQGSGSSLVGDTIARVIKRADEPAELLAIHAKMNGVGPDKVKSVLSAQMKKGIARALTNFDAYALAKYDRPGAIKMRDVFFLTHPKPKNAEQAEVWSKLVNGTLESPDTWEVGLSAGDDKAETFARLLREGKLGYLALLRNLRNMTEAGVERDLIADAILARKGASRVLPFRYVAAARACPEMEPELDEAMQASIRENMPELPGTTIVLVDVSGSMNNSLSERSLMTRMDAAAALTVIIPGDVRIYSFSYDLVRVPPRKGMAGIDAIKHSQQHSITALSRAVASAQSQEKHDRIIVITDEQGNFGDGRLPDPVVPLAYVINVGSYDNGVGYGKWLHIDGWSDATLRYISEYEEAFV